MILQLDDPPRAQVELAAAGLHRVHDNLIAQASPSHRHQIHIRDSLLGRDMLIVLRLRDRGVTFLMSIFGVASQTADSSPGQGPNDGSSSRMTTLTADQCT
jgi:hypothetical protein